MRALPARLLLRLVRFYQKWISPYRLPSCRFTPTCSEYAAEAVLQHGAFKGGALAVFRLGKCGPWHPGGWDPVPERETTDGHATARDAAARDEVTRSA
ncbi:membrane protein insertion efficiency factor YidD [Hoyosella sp. YIM 151337]|uniref:membrane protein insertion efficiency factor YidD n=1 Tax=Hoyosella sp. YIM 151337 TaxID=2992742 RepID=UPI0022358CE1|nr:membrane protein insertion efficiency factor YidD [Hoyosella sp. YIM 151337]MCW4354792.1 membrane protein insertion efficiency factor YidD [Hoyosella sp. YIM 151337]